MQIMPTEEGEVGSVATVRFQAEATARSIVTRPKLVVETNGANRVLVGDETLLTFTVSNPGSGVATGVVLAEHIPAGLKHPGGGELEYTVGDLKPGESRQLQLRLKAVQAGTIANVITARADANLRAEHRFNLEVISPQLDVALAGPKRRYLEREATYQLSVSNPGTAPAQQVELVAYLPQGLKFVNANNAGRYDEATRAVYWRLDELAGQPARHRGVGYPAGRGGAVQHQGSRGGPAGAGRSRRNSPCWSKAWRRCSSNCRTPRTRWKSAAKRPTRSRSSTRDRRPRATCKCRFLLPAELKPLAAEGSDAVYHRE